LNPYGIPEKIKRGVISPSRNSREVFLWSMIIENVLSSYNNELNWVQGIRKEIQGKSCKNLSLTI